MIGTRLPPTEPLVDLTRLERATARRRRRRLAAAILAALAGVGAGAVVFALSGGPRRSATTPPVARPELAVLLVRGGAEPLIAVVGVAGGLDPAAVVVPAATVAVLPGHGDGLIGDAADLDPEAMRTAVSNLLGVWAEHWALLDLSRLVRVAGRPGGEGGPGGVTERQVGRLLRTGRGDPVASWRSVLAGLLREPARLRTADLLAADDAEAVRDLIVRASGAGVQVMPTDRGAGGFRRPDLDATAQLLASAFGIARRPVPVIVMSDRGASAEAVAERLVPAGYRIVVSGDAGSLAVARTAVVASRPADRAEAERVRDLLGVGAVAVSRVPSGLADVTIVIGEDFGNG